jgi:hypothetical protein
METDYMEQRIAIQNFPCIAYSEEIRIAWAWLGANATAEPMPMRKTANIEEQ